MSQDDPLNFDALLSDKLKEMKEIQNQKVRALERKIQEKDEKILSLDTKYVELEGDFNYNLQVIEQRDRDLQEITDKMNQLRQICENKQKENEELKKIAMQAQDAQKRDQDKLHDQVQVLYEKIEELKQENKFYKNNLNEESNKFKEEIKSLQNQLESAKNRLTTTKEKQQSAINEALQKQEKEEKLVRENLEKIIQQLKNERNLSEEEIRKSNERLLTENERLLREVNQCKEDIFAREKNISNETLDLKNKLNELQIKNSVMERELENIRQSNSSLNNTFKEKLDEVQKEKERLNDELTRNKVKHKQKLKELRETGEQRFEELIKENTDRIRKLEGDNRELQIIKNTFEINEKSLKEKLQERELKSRRDLEDLETKFKLAQKNIEEDKRQLRNDIDVKDFQLRQISEEKENINKKLEDLQNEFLQIQTKFNDQSKENKLLLEEVVQYRQNNNLMPPKGGVIKNDQKVQKQSHKQKQLISPQHRKFNIDDELADNEEVQSFEQQFSGDEGPAMILQSVNMDNYLQSKASDSKKESKDPNAFALQHQQQFQQSSTLMNSQKQAQVLRKLKEQESQIATYKQLIESMTQDMDQVQKKYTLLQQEQTIIKEENLYLRQRMSDLQMDIMQYRDKLQRGEGFQQERTSPQKKDQKQEDQQGYQEMRQTILERDTQIKTLQEKMSKMKAEINKLKQERETLIEISNTLKSKINNYEDQLEGNGKDISQIDVKRLQAENEIAYERITELEESLAHVRKELDKWKVLDRDKQMIIEQLKQEIMEDKKMGGGSKKGLQQLSVVSYNNHLRKQSKSPPQNERIVNLPKYENFMEIDEFNKQQNLDKFKNDLMGIKAEIEGEQGIKVVSKQKPLIVRQAASNNREDSISSQKDPRDNAPVYIKQSEKETESQKRSEEQIKQNNNNRKKTPQKPRNYNLLKKDDYPEQDNNIEEQLQHDQGNQQQ